MLQYIHEVIHMDKQTFTFSINGFLLEATYSDAFLQQVKGLLQDWVKLQKEKKRRIIVFLAAPPAAGKSTLAALFEHLAKQMVDCHVQALGMDGFHHYQSYILTHTVTLDGKKMAMKDVKGCPESFDFDRLATFIRRLSTQEQMKWPIYDRVLHDVVDDQIDVTAPIVLLEGNYLLLDETPWSSLSAHCDERVFVEVDQDALKLRLIQRKLIGGTSPHEAVAFYKRSDQRNIARILAHRQTVNHTICFSQDTYQLKEKKQRE